MLQLIKLGCGGYNLDLYNSTHPTTELTTRNNRPPTSIPNNTIAPSIPFLLFDHTSNPLRPISSPFLSFPPFFWPCALYIIVTTTLLYSTRLNFTQLSSSLLCPSWWGIFVLCARWLGCTSKVTLAIWDHFVWGITTSPCVYQILDCTSFISFLFFLFSCPLYLRR